MIDLLQFIDTIPDKITRCKVVTDIKISKFPYQAEVALLAYAQHDAIHYLFGHSFNEKDEERVAYLELKFNRGWMPFGKKYNKFSPRECEYDIITLDQIDEVAKMIYKVYDYDEET